MVASVASVRMRPSAPLVVAMLIVFALPSLLQHASAGPEPPSPLATAYNTQRKVARAPDGTVYAAIVVNVNGTPQVRVISSSDGASWTTLPHPSVTAHASDRASLAIDSHARLHLVWTETTDADRQVFYAEFVAGRWTAAEQLSHSVGYAGYPSLAIDARDRAHVAWYGFDGSFYQIYYRRLEPGGWTVERALTHESLDATNPAIALGPEGHVHIAWFRLQRSGTINEVAYLRLEGDAVAETRAVSGPGVDAEDPSLAVDPAGTVHIVWTAVESGTKRLEHIARESLWSEITTVSPAAPGAVHPSLALDGRSRLSVVWEGLDGRIYIQFRDGEWSAPSVVSAGGVNRYPAARWSQYHNPTCGANSKIDVIWTEEEAGVSRLAYRALDAPFPCLAPRFESGPWILGGLSGAAVAGAAAYAVWLRRKWYPKPPIEPAR